MNKAIPTSTRAAFVLAALAAVGFVESIALAGPQQIPEQGFAWKDGAEVYTKVCALCHETHTGPILLGENLDPAYIQMIVRQGNEAMPAFRASEIDDKTLEKLAEYVSKTAAGH
jgi:4-cresol dehydrogenase (hydroxylating) cytochrome subunit